MQQALEIKSGKVVRSGTHKEIFEVFKNNDKRNKLKTLSSLILSFTVLLIFSVFTIFNARLQHYFFDANLFFTLLFTKSYQSIPRKFIKSRLVLFVYIFFYSIFNMLFTVNEDYLFNQIFYKKNLTFSLIH